jgi:hypothetical protein
MFDNSPTLHQGITVCEHAVRVEREHAFLLVLGDGFLEDPLKGLEVEKGVNVSVDEVYVGLRFAHWVLYDRNDDKNEPHAIVQCND